MEPWTIITGFIGVIIAVITLFLGILGHVQKVLKEVYDRIDSKVGVQTCDVLHKTYEDRQKENQQSIKELEKRSTKMELQTTLLEDQVRAFNVVQTETKTTLNKINEWMIKFDAQVGARLDEMHKLVIAMGDAVIKDKDRN